METAIKATIENDGHAQGTISYTTSPVHDLQTWVDLSLRLQESGCHSLAIKDMAGLLDPYQILQIDYDRSRLTVTQESDDPKNNGAIVLKVEPKDFSKLYRGTITVYAGGPDGRKAETRVHAFVQP